MDARRALLPLLSVVLGCGKTATVEQASDAGQDALDAGLADGSNADGDDEAAGSTDGGADDAPAIAPLDAAHPVTCTISNWSVLSGVSTCSVTASETCTDGNEYTVSCYCPMCSCTRNGEGGSTSTSYDGCPTCTDASTATLFGGCP